MTEYEAGQLLLNDYGTLCWILARFEGRNGKYLIEFLDGRGSDFKRLISASAADKWYDNYIDYRKKNNL